MGGTRATAEMPRGESCLASSTGPVSEFKPRDSTGVFYVLLAAGLAVLSLWMSTLANPWLWLGGQVLLAFNLLMWFAILHEAGHKTLFRTPWCNRCITHLAGFMALIPGGCWRTVHARHHYWTGWQDLDLTTSHIAPRPLAGYERWTINLCWLLWIPIFATLYRLQNYWDLVRLWRVFPQPRQRRLIALNIVSYAALYALLLTMGFRTWGWSMLLLFAPALWISFAMQDLIILSQHTHIPMHLAKGRDVQPFTPREQEVFTRSLVFPQWFARLVLLNMDAHELHHMYPQVPGYDLHKLDIETGDRISWWLWTWKAKSVRGDVLLFQNRDQTGFLF